MNKPDSHGGGLDWSKICEKSSKVITFIDLAGHEKYLKTTVFGMTGHLPDFCMLMVRAALRSWGGVPQQLTFHLLLSGGQQRWYRRHDQRTPGLGAGPQRARVRGGDQDRHVSSQHSPRYGDVVIVDGCCEEK